MIQWSFAARLAVAEYWRARSVSDLWHVRLFTDDVTPTPSFTAGAFSEASFSGYVPAEVGGWNDPFGDAPTGNVVMLMTAPVSIVRDLGPGAPQTVYGWYVTNAAGDLVICERFPEVAIFAHPLDTVLVQLKLTFGACPSS